MNFDVFKKRVESRGYCFPKLPEGIVLYKVMTLEDTDYTIQSTALDGKISSSTPCLLTVDRFLEGSEERAATIICRSLSEISLACAQLELLVKGEIKSPFQPIKNGKDLKYSFKRTSWVIQKNRDNKENSYDR